MSNEIRKQTGAIKYFQANWRRIVRDTVHPESRCNTHVAWINMSFFIDEVVKGTHLPAHQYSADYQKLQTLFTEVAPKIYYDGIHYQGADDTLRKLIWSNCDVDTATASLIKGESTSLGYVQGIWSHSKSIIEYAACSLMIGNYRDNINERFIVAGVPLTDDKRWGEIKMYMLHDVIRLVTGGTNAVKGDIKDDGKKISILGDKGWAHLYYLTDVLSPNTGKPIRYFFSRLPKYQIGKKRNREADIAVGVLQPAPVPVHI